MTPEDLEARLTGRLNSATVAAVIHELYVDPDWSVTELSLRGQPAVIEMLHHPTGTAYTLRRRRQGDALHRAEGQ